MYWLISVNRSRENYPLLSPMGNSFCTYKNWSDYCGGMTIEHEGDPKRYAVTILMGRVADQSALIGVLNSLYDMGYPILSVEYLEAG